MGSCIWLFACGHWVKVLQQFSPWRLDSLPSSQWSWICLHNIQAAKALPGSCVCVCRVGMECNRIIKPLGKATQLDTLAFVHIHLVSRCRTLKYHKANIQYARTDVHSCSQTAIWAQNKKGKTLKNTATSTNFRSLQSACAVKLDKVCMTASTLLSKSHEIKTHVI